MIEFFFYWAIQIVVVCLFQAFAIKENDGMTKKMFLISLLPAGFIYAIYKESPNGSRN